MDTLKRLSVIVETARVIRGDKEKCQEARCMGLVF